MLAAPLLPSPRFSDDSSYRPAKDLEAFNKLLPPPIEFIEGSSSGILAVAEGKYQPINESPKATVASDSKKPLPATPSKPSKTSHDSASLPKYLYTGPIDTHWPSGATVGCGLNNTGNTCFLNSALQCLLHTTPLLHILLKHTIKEPCRSPKNTYCMICALRQVMMEAYSNKTRPITPYPVITKLQLIAKHMRRGRQEDSHEFLRYLVDALQRSALAGFSPKLDSKVAETTWVYMIFGGLLRSRVNCLSCGHNSDTFDRMLDLSVDIASVPSVRDALRKFVAVDHLRGADKYKCEKCKKPVNADKQFTIQEAPLVLTVHLKRFSPMGRKIGHLVRYEERLSLESCMSDNQYGPSYSLYGVISHAGGGPNSGHYYAHVKAANGQWYEMNDESVVRHSGVPTHMKNAYILFYIRDKGQALEAALNVSTSAPVRPPAKTGLIAGMKKRKIVESDDDESERPSPPKTPKRFIGPLLPTDASPRTPAEDSSKADPQAEALKKKIAAATTQPATGALLELSEYKDDDDDDDDVGERVSSKDESGKVEDGAPVDAASASSKSAKTPEPTSPPRPPSPTTSPSGAKPANPAASSSSGPSAIPPSSFYATPASKPKKRKTPDADDADASYSKWARTPLSPPSSSSKAGNPFSRLKGSNNLQQRRESTGGGGGSRHPPKKRFMM
ncbi:hypothetical protein C8Q80DRAFT_1098354 [Daedaleopsis nitida]|nr:hypothetical protein C8Q80DRAFT_1098354 [Daedaleopsis nitida]